MKVDIMFQGEGPHLEFVEIHFEGTHEGVKIGEWSVDDDGYRILTLDVLTETEKAHYKNPEAITLLNQALDEMEQVAIKLEDAEDSQERGTIKLDALARILRPNKEGTK